MEKIVPANCAGLSDRDDEHRQLHARIAASLRAVFWRFFRGLGPLLCVYYVVALPVASAGYLRSENFTLSNGLQVILIPNHRAPIVTHMVWYRVGSADQPHGKSGLAHFFEHLMFKATSSYPEGDFSRLVARSGGRFNAFTSLDFTGYHETIPVESLGLVMSLEADRMRNLIFDPETIETERQVILQERSRAENSPGKRLSEQMNAASFLTYPYRDPVIGWREEIEQLTVEDLRAFYNAYYWPNNALVIVQGDITLPALKGLAEQHYGALPSGPVPTRLRATEPQPQAARSIVLRDPQVRDPVWRRVYIAPSHQYGASEHAPALELLARISGGGTSSRFYRSLVMEQRLALSISVSYQADLLGPSHFAVVASPRPEVPIARLAAAVEEEIQQLAREGVSADEVGRAKSRLEADAVYSRDGIGGAARTMGSALTAGQSVNDVETRLERMADVSAEKIHAAARYLLVPERSVTGWLLPEKSDDGDATTVQLSP